MSSALKLCQLNLQAIDKYLSPLFFLQGGQLNGKLLQVLERRKAKEAEAKHKLEVEAADAMKRKDKFHQEQLELMDAAHHR